MTKQEFIDYMKEHDIYGREDYPNSLCKHNNVSSNIIHLYDKYFCNSLNGKHCSYKYTKANADKLIAAYNIELEEYDDN